MTTDNRTPIQNEAFKKLFKYNNLLLKWGTGTGKSRVAVLACDYIYDRSLDKKILLLVAERAHKENWKKEFVKFLGEELAREVLSIVTIECYASMHKYQNTAWNFIIFDECHHLQSEKRREVLETMESEYVLALSATPGEKAYDALSWTFGRFEIDKISIQDAIDSEYLPEPKIVCIPLELERFERTEIITLDYRTKESGDKGDIRDIWSNRWKYTKNKAVYTGWVIYLSCTQKEKYEYINEQFEYWKHQYFINQDNIRLKNMWLQWGSKRKRFLGELKTRYAEALIQKLRKNKKRFICFCTSIDQAHALGGERAVHSENHNSPVVIQSFNDRKIDEIFAVDMLVEGVTLTDIEAGIIVQLDGNERQFIQKSGRMYRSENPLIYIFYYRGTRDEEYLQKALEGINQNYIEIKET